MKTNVFVIIILLLVSCNSQKDDFKLCFNKKYPYYNPKLNYEGGFYEIKKHFFDNFKEIDGEGNTGIVRIQFQVNCLGKTGNYQIETYSNNFEKSVMANEITEQLIQLTKDLQKWIPAVNDNGESVDIHKFLAFKLEKGKLIDILPK